MIVTSFDDLLVRGYKKHGNWYIKDNISINLCSNTVKVHNIVIVESSNTLLNTLDVTMVESIASGITCIRKNCK
jgi:hypothetical protein